MGKLFKYLITIIMTTVILFLCVALGIVYQKKGVFQSSYQSLIVDKYRILQKTDEKKIIMIAGSSSAFGLDQNMLEDETGYRVVNLGLHAGFGHLFHSELAKENINPGDIVLLGYEYGWENNFETLGQDLIMTGIDDNIDMYKHIPTKHWPDFIGYLFKYAEKKNTYTGASGIYSREAFDSINGQMTMERNYAMSDYQDNISAYGTISVIGADGNISISDRSIEYLTEMKEYVESRGASIYFVSSPILYDSVTCNSEDFIKLVALEEEEIGIPYISDPRLYMFPIDLMSNAVNHCNSDGEEIRTSILIDDLRKCGAIDNTAYSEIVITNIGETFVLVDTLPKRFFNKPVTVKKVYSIINGVETVYQENIDYIVDYDRGSIRRTVESGIPNYSGHDVVYSGGKFAWINDSENYNPESNRNYQIRVDYEYCACQDELNTIENKSNYLSDTLRNKILNGEQIKISLCGDSIGAGADTNGEGIFLNYLEEEIESNYDIEVDSQNLSVEGGDSGLLIDKLDDIISEDPDVLLIEFGMNDHCGADASTEECVQSYKNDIEQCVIKMKENGIDVILVGFPQQNMTWDVENTYATKLYNEALNDIADRNNVYFADTYSIFEKVGNIKPLNRDVMADFIHHPNEWGHKLYFSCLLPVFNIDGDMKPVDIKNYIFVG